MASAGSLHSISQDTSHVSHEVQAAVVHLSQEAVQMCHGARHSSQGAAEALARRVAEMPNFPSSPTAREGTVPHSHAPPPLGYCVTSVSGEVRTMHIPFEYFTGSPDGTAPHILELITKAATITKTFTIFENQCVDAALSYQWKTFGYALFLQDLATELLGTFLVLGYGFVSVTLNVELDLQPRNVSSPDVSIVSAWDTVAGPVDAENALPGELDRQLLWLYMILWTVVFVGLLSTIGRMAVLILIRRRHVPLRERMEIVGAVTQAIACLVPIDSHRCAGPDCVTDSTRMSTIFQAASVLAHMTTLLHFFRGNLALGSFIYKIEQITIELAPVLFSSAAVMSVFSFSILLLLAEEFKDWYTALGNTLSIANRALRLPMLAAYAPMGTPMDGLLDPGNSWWPIVILYEVFVVFGQLFLLNMMIGVVGRVNMSVHQNADRVARYERGLVILDKEYKLLAGLARSADRTASFGRTYRLGEKLHVICCNLLPKALQTQHLTAAEIRPAWLHVLLPPAGSVARTGQADARSRANSRIQ